MRQGDGSDLLGPGDPRNSEIGVLYVDPRDSRQEILTAISTQDLQGRKQIAIVLPEQGKAFRQPLDFDGLKNVRRQLKAQLIFIAPSGPGPAEFARQRRFAVYSSLDTFKSALLNEGLPSPNPRVKSRPDPARRAGILGFGRNRARASQEPTPADDPVIPVMPPTPRTPTPPTPLVMPTTPRPPAQPGMSAIPSTPNQPGIPSTPRVPAQNIDKFDTIETGQSGATPGDTQGKPGVQAQSGQTTSGLEGDDDALYTPPAQGNAPKPIAQGSATQSAQANPNAPAKTPPENRPAASIIAFPTVPPSTPKATTGKMKGTKRNSGKMPPAPNDPADAQTPGVAGAAFIAGAATSGLNAPDPNQPGATPGATPPANGKKGASTGKIAATPADGQSGATPGAPTSGGKTNGGKGKSGALIAGTGAAALGGAAIGAAAAQGNAGNKDTSSGSSVATAGGTRAPGASSPPARGGGAGGPGGVQRPAGLTPLPPPYSRRARRRRNRLIAALVLILILLAGTLTWSVLAQRGVLPGISGLPGLLPGNVNATVTITPDSKLESDSYVFAGITGTPDPTRLQVQARLLTQTSPTQTATANATGSINATRASGPLKFFNANIGSVTLASTTLTAKNGVSVSFNGPITIPGSGTLVVTGSAVNPGINGNITAGDISGSCCSSNISVNNPSAFSGGQDAVPNTVIQQSDIDNAARPLIDSLKQSTQTELAKQVRSNERVAESTLQCTPTITSSQQAGSVAKTAAVQVSLACTEQVYDLTATQQIATTRLRNSVSLDPQYTLDGQIVTSVIRVTQGDNQLSIQVQAQGLWVYGFNAQLQQNIKQSLVKLSKIGALSVLRHEIGVANATISLSNGDTMPANASNITLVIQQLPGAQVTPPPGPGTPSTNPTTQPTSAPQGSPTPVNGLGGS